MLKTQIVKATKAQEIQVMKARRHDMHTLESPEASEGRGAKEHVEFEPAREHARHKTHEV